MTGPNGITAEDKLNLNSHVDTQDSRNVRHLPVDHYVRFLSKASVDLKLAPLRALFPLEGTPGLLSLLSGKPDEDLFPFTSVSFTATSPEGPSKGITATLASSALKEALQYGLTDGLPGVKKWIMGLQEYMHKRKHGEGWTVTMGVGSQDLTYKAIRALIDPGDSILIESPSYTGVISIFASLRCEQIEVETDLGGVNPESLRKILQSWPTEKPKPKLLYTVPYGGNPAGITTTTARRKEILALAREHDFLIIEDDPYYWLYYGDGERPLSYFQLERELPEVGRVLRFDSFSKLLSGGIRFGWASGPEALIESINVQTGSSNLHPSSLTQAMVLALVKQWGYHGLESFSQQVSRIYRAKRDIFDKALQAYLGDLAEWHRPESGLFFWVKLHLNPEGSGDSGDLVVTKGLQNGVLALPGSASFPDRRKSAYVRLSFSLLQEEQVHEALKRLRAVIMSEREEKTSLETDYLM